MVRPYVGGDLPAVGRVHALSRQAAYAGLVAADALAQVTPERQTEVWRERMEWPATTAFVAERDADVVGFVVLLETDDGVELNAIHVLPEAQGTGTGRALLGTAVEHARAHGVRRLHLFVIHGNRRAQEFYRRQGWRSTGLAGTHEIAGQRVPVVGYALDLA